MNPYEAGFHPFFVYGTLRPGGGLAYLWQGRATAIDDGAVRLSGFDMSTDGPFPYITEGDGDVVGALIVPSSTRDFVYLMHELDSIEGHPHHYKRRVLYVQNEHNGHPAWVYVGQRSGRIPIPSGDWMEWRHHE